MADRNKCNAFCVFLFLNALLCSDVLAQHTDSIGGRMVQDTIVLKEITVEQSNQRKISGNLTGKITLHTEGVKTLPSIMGTVDMLKLLELTPGVQTAGDGNSNMYVRGGDPGQNKLLYCNSPIYTPGHMLSFFPLFNVDHVTSVELLKSGVEPRYGDFLSSTILIKNKSELPRKVSLKGTAGLLSSQATLSLPLGKKFGAYVSGRGSYMELLLKPFLKVTMDQKSRADLDQTKYDFYDTNITVLGELSENNRLSFDFFAGNDDLNVDEETLGLTGVLRWGNLSFSTNLVTRLSESSTLEQYVYMSRFQNRLHTSQAKMHISLLSRMEDMGYGNKLNYSLGGIPFQSGVQYKHYRILPQQNEIENVDVTYRPTSTGRMSANALALFTSSPFWINDDLLVEPGVRYNLFNSRLEESGKSKTFHNVDFRFSSRYRLRSDQFLRSALSHNTQYVNKLTPSSAGLPTDFWVAASSQIRPQKGTEMSVGYFRMLEDNNFDVSGDVFVRQMSDLTEFNQNFLQNENIPFTDKIFYGKGRAYGMELMLKKNTGKLTGWISYTLARSERSFPDIDDGRTFPAKYDRRHDLSVVAAYAFNEKWDVSTVFVYATGNTYTQPTSWYFMNNMPVKDYHQYNNARMPNYKRNDISVNYWFKKDNGLNFSIYNMFAVNNPIYVFLVVGYPVDKDGKEDTARIQSRIKKKKLLTVVPSISWRFKF